MFREVIAPIFALFAVLFCLLLLVLATLGGIEYWGCKRLPNTVYVPMNGCYVLDEEGTLRPLHNVNEIKLKVQK